MGVRSRRAKKRKKSSESDNEGYHKQFKNGASNSDSDTVVSDSFCVSDIISEANSILFEQSDSYSTCNSYSNRDTTFISPSPPPSRNINNIATTGQTIDMDMSQKLDSILAAVAEIKKYQEGMRKMFESKLDKMRQDLTETIDSRVRSLRDELSLDINRETSRIDQVMITIQSLQARLDTVENTNRSVPAGVVLNENRTHQRGNISAHQDDPDLSITASGIPYE